jgi:hypothetical protein
VIKTHLYRSTYNASIPRLEGKNKYTCRDFLYYLLCPCKTSLSKRNANVKTTYQKWVEFKKEVKQFENDRDDAAKTIKFTELEERFDLLIKQYNGVIKQLRGDIKEMQTEEVSKDPENNYGINYQGPTPQKNQFSQNQVMTKSKVNVKGEREESISNLLSKGRATSEHKGEVKSIHKIVKREVKQLLTEKEQKELDKDTIEKAIDEFDKMTVGKFDDKDIEFRKNKEEVKQPTPSGYPKI